MKAVPGIPHSSAATPSPGTGDGIPRRAAAWAVAFLLLIAGTAAVAQEPVWKRGRDGRFEVAVAGIASGSTLGFWCSAYQVPNTAIIGLRHLLLSPQLSDGEHYDMRFVIDGQRFDLRGIAKDGELMVSPADANMELRVRELLDALIAGKNAQIAVPSKAWKSALPLDGAADALPGVFDVCL
jgi:hypothetical protein